MVKRSVYVNQAETKEESEGIKENDLCMRNVVHLRENSNLYCAVQSKSMFKIIYTVT